MKYENENIPENLSDHAKAVWAAKILATHRHRDYSAWIVLTTEEFSVDREVSKIEVLPKDRLTAAGLISGWTANEACAIAKSYVGC